MTYKILVLAGASAKGVIFLGILQYLHEQEILSNIDIFIGTSIGAIISYLYIIGYKPTDLSYFLFSSDFLIKLQNLDLLSFINGKGALSYNHIQEHLEKLTIDKLGFIPTFLDLKTLFGKTLICSTYNLTMNCQEYISFENYPHTSCIIGLKMSSNLPLVFERFKYNHCFYIDGGIFDNFPIQIADQMGFETLSFIINQKELDKFPPQISTLKYIYNLISISMVQYIKEKIKNAPKTNKIFEIEYPMEFLNFHITTKDIHDMFSLGYNYIKINLIL